MNVEERAEARRALQRYDRAVARIAKQVKALAADHNRNPHAVLRHVAEEVTIPGRRST